MPSIEVVVCRVAVDRYHRAVLEAEAQRRNKDPEWEKDNWSWKMVLEVSAADRVVEDLLVRKGLHATVTVDDEGE